MIDTILKRIETALKRCGRSPNDVQLIAVTKTHPLSECLPLLNYGIQNFGENRLPEALEKMEGAPPQINWHFIGSLQRKKVPKIIGRFSLIHSVDSLSLAEKISECSVKSNLTTPILIQVNTSNESTKHGLTPEALKSEYSQWSALPNIKIEGLMTMAPLTDDQTVLRSTFSALRELRDRLHLRHLSMGMSRDFEIAIEEGATLLRIGSALWDFQN